MGSQLKAWLYILVGILIVGTVAVLAIQLLVWVLPIILVLYVIYKIKQYIDIKRSKKSNTNFNYKSQNKSNVSSDFVESVDDSISEVIDVEYEDVNK